MMRMESAGPARLPTAPLAPVAVAVAAGITVDRDLFVRATAAWAMLALAGALIGVLFRRRGTPLFHGAMLIAWAALGGGWHHARWSDLAPQDVALRASESPQPAWLRGVLLEVPSFRPGARGLL